MGFSGEEGQPELQHGAVQGNPGRGLPDLQILPEILSGQGSEELPERKVHRQGRLHLVQRQQKGGVLLHGSPSFPERPEHLHVPVLELPFLSEHGHGEQSPQRNGAAEARILSVSVRGRRQEVQGESDFPGISGSAGNRRRKHRHSGIPDEGKDGVQSVQHRCHFGIQSGDEGPEVRISKGLDLPQKSGVRRRSGAVKGLHQPGAEHHLLPAVQREERMAAGGYPSVHDQHHGTVHGIQVHGKGLQSLRPHRREAGIRDSGVQEYAVFHEVAEIKKQVRFSGRFRGAEPIFVSELLIVRAAFSPLAGIPFFETPVNSIQNGALSVAPFRRHQKAALGVGGEAVHRDVFRNDLQEVYHQLAVFFDGSERYIIRHHVVQTGAPDDVQHVKLDAEGVNPGHVGHGIEHVLPAFARKPQDDVNHRSDAPPVEFGNRLVEGVQGVTDAHGFGGFWVNGLKAQFHPEEVLPVDFFQQIQHVLAQAVRPGGDGDAVDSGIRKRIVIVFSKNRHRCVGVGVVLEISDVPGMGPFLAEEFNLFRDGRGELAGTGRGAEGAAPGAQGSVPVGAGEPRIQRELDGFFAKGLFEIIVYRKISFSALHVSSKIVATQRAT